MSRRPVLHALGRAPCVLCFNLDPVGACIEPKASFEIVGDNDVKALVGAAIALALLEALQEQGLLSAEEVQSIYLKARQKAVGFPQADLVDNQLDSLARKNREDD